LFGSASAPLSGRMRFLHDELRGLDVARTTPMDALAMLHLWQQSLNENETEEDD